MSALPFAVLIAVSRLPPEATVIVAAKAVPVKTRIPKARTASIVREVFVAFMASPAPVANHPSTTFSSPQPCDTPLEFRFHEPATAPVAQPIPSTSGLRGISILVFLADMIADKSQSALPGPLSPNVCLRGQTGILKRTETVWGKLFLRVPATPVRDEAADDRLYESISHCRDNFLSFFVIH